MRPAVLMLTTAAILVACSSPSPEASAVAQGGSAGPSASTGKPVDGLPSGLPFAAAEMGTFDEPFAIAFLPDGSLLVTEKAGILKLRRPDGRIVEVGGVPAVVKGGQGGLLDVAVAPDFARSGLIYLSYSEPRSAGSSLALMRAKLSAAGEAGQLSGQTVIFRAGADGAGGQYGANIAFAPDGKSLFLASGERQRFTPAQDPDQTLGKILHLKLDGKPWPGNPGKGRTGAPAVTVFDPPKDSVAAKTATGRSVPVEGANLAPAEIWSSGHRNPYGLAFDAQGGLWEVEMGPKGGDELNKILPGRNYGWPNASNGDNYDGIDIPDHRPGDGYEAPKLWWNPSISPGGMMIYSGAMFPQWRGSAFLTALSGKSLIRTTLGATPAKADRWEMKARLRDVAQAPDGAIWVIEDGGRGPKARLIRLTPKG
jgi:glucose/arabinose dehydrogenase